MSQKQSEKELAAHVVKWLKERGWEVYQEVRIFYGSKVADIVATKEIGVKPTTIAWVIECKTSLNSELLEQARYWTAYSDYVSIAVPEPVSKSGHRRKSPWIVDHALRTYGIGRIEVSGSFCSEGFPSAVLHRANRRYRACHVINYLCDEQKTMVEAGGNRGGYFTPFRSTINALEKFVSEHPGCTMKEAIAGIEHHYSNDACAKGSIAKWIHLGKIKTLRLEAEGRKLRLFCTEGELAQHAAPLRNEEVSAV